MMKLYRLKLVYYKIIKNKKKINEIKIKNFKNNGMIIGDNCKIYSDISIGEPYLIEIGNDVTISNNVRFITHDNSVSKINSNYTDMFGKVKIGSNCFIGYNTLILPGVSICSNVIVAAGSVVTKSVEVNNVIVAGNPARIICTWDEYIQKNNKFFKSIRGMNCIEKEKFIKNLPVEELLKK